MNEVELYDTMDQVSGFTPDAEGNPITVTPGKRLYFTETINAQPDETREKTLKAWAYQRHLRDVQDLYDQNSALACMVKLEEAGVHVPPSVYEWIKAGGDA